MDGLIDYGFGRGRVLYMYIQIQELQTFFGDDSVKIGGGDDKRSSSDDGSGATDGKHGS